MLGEDSYLAREGIISALEASGDVELLASCEDLDGLRTAIDEHEPDVVLTDIRMPPSNTDEGIRLAAELRETHPKVGVVVISQHSDPLYAIALFDATPEMIGSIMFIHGVGLALFNIPGGMMSDRMGRRLPALAGSLVATAGVLWYSAAGSYWALFVAVGLAGAGAAFSTPAVSALTADVCDPKRRGEAFGYLLTSFNLGMVAGALVYGGISAIALAQQWPAIKAWLGI